MLARRIERREDDVALTQVIDRATLLAMQAAVELVHVEPSVGRYIVDARRGDTREHEPRGRREPARQPRAAEALPLPGRARRTRLRHPGRRQGGRGAGARPPARSSSPSSGCSAARGEDVVRETLERCRRRRPRTSARRTPRLRTSSRAVTPFASPRLASYLALSALGLIAALALRRAGARGRRGSLRAHRRRGAAARGAARGARLAPRSTTTGSSRETRSRRRSRSTPRRPVDLLELHLVLPRRARRRRGRQPLRPAARTPARSGRCRSRSAASAGARSSSATSGCARADGSGCSSGRAASAGRTGSASTRGPSSCRASSRRSRPSS